MGKGIKMSYFYTQFKAGLTWAWQISATAFKCIFFSLYIPLSRRISPPPPCLISAAIQPSYLTAMQSSTPSCQNNNWYSGTQLNTIDSVGEKWTFFCLKIPQKKKLVLKTQYFALLSLPDIKKDLIRSSQVWKNITTCFILFRQIIRTLVFFGHLDLHLCCLPLHVLCLLLGWPHPRNTFSPKRKPKPVKSFKKFIYPPPGTNKPFITNVEKQVIKIQNRGWRVLCSLWSSFIPKRNQNKH